MRRFFAAVLWAVLFCVVLAAVFFGLDLAGEVLCCRDFDDFPDDGVGELLVDAEDGGAVDCALA